MGRSDQNKCTKNKLRHGIKTWNNTKIYYITVGRVSTIEKFLRFLVTLKEGIVMSKMLLEMSLTSLLTLLIIIKRIQLLIGSGVGSITLYCYPNSCCNTKAHTCCSSFYCGVENNPQTNYQVGAACCDLGYVWLHANIDCGL